jgi:predicted RNA methylase
VKLAPRVADGLFLTTQPGWAFATLAEVRARGLPGHVPFWHRDSSLVVSAVDTRLSDESDDLATPAGVYGLVVGAAGTPREDATRRLRRRLEPEAVKRRVLRWLPQIRPTPGAGGPGVRARRYSVESEVWGETALHRHTLADLVREAVTHAFPRWSAAPTGGVRFLCKADPQMASLGLQLYSNLSQEDDLRPGRMSQRHRPGTLRNHLACALLTLAGVTPGDAVLDPFMGTGTILRAAWERFGVSTCIGAEIDPAAYRVAQRNVRAPDPRLHSRSFDELDVTALPRSIALVSNLPFGRQFAPVPTTRLLAFLVALDAQTRSVALLMGREQAQRVAPALRLRARNVLVLGQPAAIVYSDERRHGA